LEWTSGPTSNNKTRNEYRIFKEKPLGKHPFERMRK
jgi:hypothetical protein